MTNSSASGNNNDVATKTTENDNNKENGVVTEKPGDSCDAIGTENDKTANNVQTVSENCENVDVASKNDANKSSGKMDGSKPFKWTPID